MAAVTGDVTTLATSSCSTLSPLAGTLDGAAADFVLSSAVGGGDVLAFFFFFNKPKVLFRFTVF